jgi:formate/nitrite transporter FocA (FNT family)
MAPEKTSQPPEEGTLEGRDAEQAEQRSTIGAPVVLEAVAHEGREELERHPAALAWSGLAAGLSMGFSLVAEGLLQAHIPATPWRPLVSKLGYSIGFLIVVMGRQQLFTENTLTVVLPLLQRRDRETFWKVIRLWTVVLACNLLGAFAFAYVTSHTDLFTPAVKAAFVDIGAASLKGGFGLTVLRAVFAAWLIALMVWLLPVAQESRLQVIIIITWLVALGGFAHIVAGATEVFNLLWLGRIGAGEVLVRFFVPTLIGNVVGGVSLVAMVNHNQVNAGQGAMA